MIDRSREIFGNKMPAKTIKKAAKSKAKYIRKYGDDSGKDYKVTLSRNPYIGDSLGVINVLVGDLKTNAHYDENAAKETLDWDREKGIIVGNIRMGFGHYRISMAIASAARALGYTPYWMDLNSYKETTCTKVISARPLFFGLQTFQEPHI